VGHFPHFFTKSGKLHVRFWWAIHYNNFTLTFPNPAFASMQCKTGTCKQGPRIGMFSQLSNVTERRGSRAVGFSLKTSFNPLCKPQI
jgi:hypothetical protein